MKLAEKSSKRLEIIEISLRAKKLNLVTFSPMDKIPLVINL